MERDDLHQVHARLEAVDLEIAELRRKLAEADGARGGRLLIPEQLDVEETAAGLVIRMRRRTRQTRLDWMVMFGVSAAGLAVTLLRENRSGYDGGRVAMALLFAVLAVLLVAVTIVQLVTRREMRISDGKLHVGRAPLSPAAPPVVDARVDPVHAVRVSSARHGWQLQVVAGGRTVLSSLDRDEARYLEAALRSSARS